MKKVLATGWIKKLDDGSTTLGVVREVDLENDAVYLKTKEVGPDGIVWQVFESLTPEDPDLNVWEEDDA